MKNVNITYLMIHKIEQNGGEFEVSGTFLMNHKPTSFNYKLKEDERKLSIPEIEEMLIKFYTDYYKEAPTLDELRSRARKQISEYMKDRHEFEPDESIVSVGIDNIKIVPMGFEVYGEYEVNGITKPFQVDFNKGWHGKSIQELEIFIQKELTKVHDCPVCRKNSYDEKGYDISLDPTATGELKKILEMVGDRMEQHRQIRNEYLKTDK